MFQDDYAGRTALRGAVLSRCGVATMHARRLRHTEDLSTNFAAASIP